MLPSGMVQSTANWAHLQVTDFLRCRGTYSVSEVILTKDNHGTLHPPFGAYAIVNWKIIGVPWASPLGSNNPREAGTALVVPRQP